MGDRLRYSSGWRDHRDERSDTGGVSRKVRRGLFLVLMVGGVFGWLFSLLFAGTWISSERETIPDGVDEKEKTEEGITISDLLRDGRFLGIDELDWEALQNVQHFQIDRNGLPLVVESTLDLQLQKYISDLLAKSQTVQAAVVLLRPEDGRILAMVSHGLENNGENLCLKASFPAASLFKIVAAAAALETAGFTPEKPVSFDGGRYTLYKGQLKPTTGRYASTLPFKEAFGASINPVFGRLGIYDLGQQAMADYAERFLFNQTIPFDLPVEESVITVPEDSFGLAEIASGFNKETLISPLHAAMVSCAIVNQGVMMQPYLVHRIFHEDGREIYFHQPQKAVTVFDSETARDLRILMQETVESGTCSRSFSSFRRKNPFREFEWGAKTGSINDQTGTYRIDWLAAYGIPPDSDRGICLAILGVHGKMLGVRANRLGQSILEYYFSS